MRTLSGRRLVVPLAVLAVAGTGLAAYGAAADDAVRYRTVQAALGDVEQVLDLSGVVEATGRADLAFGTAGEVSRVPVAVGDQVRQGEVIAVLDRASLRASVDRGRADLASAKAQLAADRDTQAAAVAAAASSSTAGKSDGKSAAKSPTTAPSATSSPTAAPTPDLAVLTAQQDAVLAAQTAAGTALATSTAALHTQQTACAASGPATGEESARATVDGADQPTGHPAEGTTVTDDCARALAAVQSAQAATADAQDTLQQALTTLTATLTAALGELTAQDAVGADTSGKGGNPTATATPTPTTGGTGGPGGTGGASANGGDTRTVTAATLADDQAAIDRARADLAAARADLRAAVVRAPAGGTVVALPVARGDVVATGDTVAVVVAPGVTTVALEATAAQAAQLAVGTPVVATPAGADEPLIGVVGRVAGVPTSTTDTDADPTYAVEVTLDQRNLTLPDGLPAAVEVVVASAEDAVTLPASAVADGTVTTLVGAETRQVPVVTGVVGGTEVEILDGIEAGTEVVLADLDADLPSGGSEDQGPGGLGGDLGVVRMGPPGSGVTIRR
ncbi:HlyD family efflux transporter periplasmic adaptor subunit [Nocardioides sp. LHD-245]|uniref:HlyD family efflux transporter periplasmic adaptor subunit n=1 Tax=Nocardioides sp. LHD-245 TaxID=3051387 RepID=UPI0027E02ECF|nr:HlyD family efflux transporter periplasmic adaptor subunit [Nocardioides sp. LHD-245]